MDVLFWIIGATVINSLIALAGAIPFFAAKEKMKKVIGYMVAFSAGTLLSGAFFHLLVESFEELTPTISFYIMITSFISFFLIEKVLHWHHCHDSECDILSAENHTTGQMILIGDSIHNFIDGLVIAASFIAGIPFGIVTTFAILSHELPQELGDFAVLIHGGFGKRKALIWNFIAQTTSILGGIIGYLLAGAVGITIYFLPLAAGGFIYIATSDLIPELKREREFKKSIGHFTAFIIGILLMIGMKMFFKG